jgi:hypothetical protein
MRIAMGLFFLTGLLRADFIQVSSGEIDFSASFSTNGNTAAPLGFSASYSQTLYLYVDAPSLFFQFAPNPVPCAVSRSNYCDSFAFVGLSINGLSFYNGVEIMSNGQAWGYPSGPTSMPYLTPGVYAVTFSASEQYQSASGSQSSAAYTETAKLFSGGGPVSLAPAPEPATWGMAGIGMLAALTVRRRTASGWWRLLGPRC